LFVFSPCRILQPTCFFPKDVAFIPGLSVADTVSFDIVSCQPAADGLLYKTIKVVEKTG